MIKYALACDKGHTFESWFADSAAYDKQAKRGLVSCPQCGSAKVEKAIMAPRLSGTRKRATSLDVAVPQDKAPVAVMSPVEQELRSKLKELREHIVKNADNVGEKFPEEARKIHYGETPDRHIYGEATHKEAQELLEEGVDVAPLPPDRDSAN